MCFNMRLQLVEDFHGQYLRGCHLALHEIHVKVDIPMIELIDYIAVDDMLQFFQIDYKSRFRIHFAFHRYKKLIIVAMPIRIGAFAKYRFVLFQCPLLAVQLVCRVKPFTPCKIYHRLQRYVNLVICFFCVFVFLCFCL